MATGKVRVWWAWVAGWWPVAMVVVACAACVGVPGVNVVWRVAVGLAQEDGWATAREAASVSGGGWRRLGLSAGVGLLIAVLAMGLGWWPAWMSARGGWGRRWGIWWRGAMVAPLMMPVYLAYSGWGMARAPGTVVARWLEDLAAGGLTDAPVWGGRVMAVVGLALWCWPLAMVSAWAAFSRLDEDVLDQSRLVRGGWRVRVRMMGAGLAAGVGVVWLVMLGSAVPLHLAQIETDAIRLWRLLDQTSATERWSAWVGAWPTLLVAVAAGVWLGRRASGRGAWGAGWRSGTRGGDRRLSRAGVVWGVGLWVVSVLGPLVLFAWSIKLEGSLWRFWSLHGGSVWSSVGVAACVGVVGMVLAWGAGYGFSWAGEGRWRAGLMRVALVVWLVAAIVPGVMVGSATLDAWSGGWMGGAGWVADSSAIVVMTHVCRFGALAMLAGAWLSRQEGWELRAVRSLEGTTGAWAWTRTIAGRGWLVVAGAGGAMGLLSLHEIESAVIVQPAGVESLPRHILSLLHFSRDEELSAAAVWMIGLGMVPAVVIGAAMAAGMGRRATGVR